MWKLLIVLCATDCTSVTEWHKTLDDCQTAGANYSQAYCSAEDVIMAKRGDVWEAILKKQVGI